MAVAFRPPPPYGRIGSLLPWNARIGTGPPSHGARNSSPATGATAVIRSDIRHASNDDICAPLDMPVENTRLGSTHKVASSASSSLPTKSTSKLSAVGAANQYGVVPLSRPDGATPMNRYRSARSKPTIDGTNL